ncbi:hypothetical protein [Flavobacterium subsaxonicum]|uniref:Uncharacterized protein n=1 Tax=Flavobacterium subsaxonicum WB 4.1-42 = DSM 21790 TaxID=1121898 RepID=A0A0A2MNW5_9FLAO|nr:hypothetical protein [Flavobacterium subsaxonicum]KGO93241.1 hypothetical protein Q766_08010 [Flavobacterium subsaxonicum WB 4.1-42 = DSM 21790]
MKRIHQINVVALGLTTVVYIIPYFGMLLQIPLAIIQLIIASIITSKYKTQLDNKHRAMLKKYWLMVLTAFILIVALCIGAAIAKNYDFKYSNNLFMILPGIIICSVLFVFPMFIAFYSGYTTFSITKYLLIKR